MGAEEECLASRLMAAPPAPSTARGGEALARGAPAVEQRQRRGSTDDVAVLSGGRGQVGVGVRGTVAVTVKAIDTNPAAATGTAA